MNTTIESVVFDFTYQGIKFRSRVLHNSPLLTRILNLPEEVFQKMNQDFISENWEGDFSPSNIEIQLNKLNENGSHAFIELVKG